MTELLDEAVAKFRDDPRHSGLRFKKVHRTEPVYSVRVSQGYRAVGVLQMDAIIWFWIGSHADYDRLLSQLSMESWPRQITTPFSTALGVAWLTRRALAPGPLPGSSGSVDGGSDTYVSTPLYRAAAIDARTGRTLWIHDPRAYESGMPAITQWRHRGVPYWENDGDAPFPTKPAAFRRPTGTRPSSSPSRNRTSADDLPARRSAAYRADRRGRGTGADCVSGAGGR